MRTLTKYGIALLVLIVGGAAVLARTSSTPPRAATALSKGAAGEHKRGVPAPAAAKPRAYGSPLGLPRAEAWNLIPVWTTAGEAQYLNGGLRPVLVFPVGDGALAKKVMQEFHPNEVVLVAAGFPAEPLGRALSQTSRLGAALGQTVYALQGPPGTYLGKGPVLGYVGHLATEPTVIPVGKGLTKAEVERAVTHTLDGIP